MARHALLQAGADRPGRAKATDASRHGLLDRWRLVHDGSGALPPRTVQAAAAGPREATPTPVPWFAARDA